MTPNDSPAANKLSIILNIEAALIYIKMMQGRAWRKRTKSWLSKMEVCLTDAKDTLISLPPITND